MMGPGESGGGRALLRRAQPAFVLGPPGVRSDCARRSHDRARGGAPRLFRIVAWLAQVAGKPLAAAAAGAARALLSAAPVCRRERDGRRLRGGRAASRCRDRRHPRSFEGNEMLRILTVRVGHHRLAGCARTTALRRRSHRRLRGWRLPRQKRRQRPSRNMALSASTAPEWTRSHRPGRRFLRLRQRHLGEEHADSRRQVELWRVHRAPGPSQQRVRDILDAAKDDPSSTIGVAYASFLDEAAVEAKGLTPIQPWLDEIRGLKTARLCRAVGQCRSQRRHRAVRRRRRPGRPQQRCLHHRAWPVRARHAGSRHVSAQ